MENPPSRPITSDKHFYLPDGRPIKDIHELVHHFDRMSDDDFAHHVNEEKNDFSNWVGDVFGDRHLAEKLRSTRCRKSSKAVVEGHLQLRSRSTGAYHQKNNKEVNMMRRANMPARAGQMARPVARPMGRGQFLRGVGAAAVAGGAAMAGRRGIVRPVSAQGTTTVVGTGNPVVDVPAVQNAVNNYDIVYLQGTFDFGGSYVSTTKPVEIIGQNATISNGFGGFVMWGMNDVKIRNINFTNITWAIYRPGPNNVIEGNTFSYCHGPIYGGNPSNSVIQGNTMTNISFRCIQAKGCANLIIRNNNMTNVSGHATWLELCHGLTFTGNTITGARQRGIYVKNCNDFVVSGNAVLDHMASNGIDIYRQFPGQTVRNGIVSDNEVHAKVGAVPWSGFSVRNKADYQPNTTGPVENITLERNVITGTYAGEAIFIAEADGGIIKDNDTTGAIGRNRHVRLRVNGYEISGNKFGGVDLNTAYAETIIEGSNNMIIDNDYRQSGIPGWAVRADGGYDLGCVLLTETSANNQVFESGNFPAGTGGGYHQCLDLGTNNRVVGLPANQLDGNQGIGAMVSANRPPEEPEPAEDVLTLEEQQAEAEFASFAP